MRISVVGSLRNHLLRLMASLCNAFQVFCSSFIDNASFCSFADQLEKLFLNDGFSFYVYLVFMYSRPVSLTRAVKTLCLIGLVSHSGQSRHSLNSLIFKHSAQAFIADTVPVLYQ